MKTNTETNKDLLFKEMNQLLYEFGYSEPSSTFKILNEFQNSKLDGIEKANNGKHRIAMQRTIDYYTVDFMPKWDRSKNKDKLLFKLVNLFVLDIPEFKHVDSSCYSIKIFKELSLYSEKIVESKKWYLDVIPESKWLIEYFEQQQKGLK